MAFLMDANGEELVVGSQTLFDNLSPLTVYGWMRVTSGSVSRRIVSKGFDNTTSVGWEVLHTSASRFGFNRAFSSVNGIWSAASVPQSTTWVHMAVTYDDSSTDNDPLLYYDAVSQSVTEDSAPSGTASDDGVATLVLGNINHGTVDGLREINGRLCNVGIHEAILSVGQIQTAMSHGWVAGNSMRGFWPCLDSGVDLSGNGNNATVNNATVADHAPVGPMFGFDLGWQGAFTIAAAVEAAANYLGNLERHYPRGVNRGVLRGAIR